VLAQSPDHGSSCVASLEAHRRHKAKQLVRSLRRTGASGALLGKLGFWPAHDNHELDVARHELVVRRNVVDGYRAATTFEYCERTPSLGDRSARRPGAKPSDQQGPSSAAIARKLLPRLRSGWMALRSMSRNTLSSSSSAGPR